MTNLTGKIHINCFLTIRAKFNRNGFQQGKPSCRVTKSKPALDSHEVCVELNLNIPKQLFAKPQLTATVDVPEPATDFEIDSIVQDEIAQAIAEAAGMNVTLEVKSDG